MQKTTARVDVHPPAAAPEPSVVVKVGQIVEIDRSHLAVAKKLGARAKYAAKVLEVALDERRPGWSYLTAFSTKAAVQVMVAVPPKGHRWVGPKVKVIR